MLSEHRVRFVNFLTNGGSGEPGDSPGLPGRFGCILAGGAGGGTKQQPRREGGARPGAELGPAPLRQLCPATQTAGSAVCGRLHWPNVLAGLYLDQCQMSLHSLPAAGIRVAAPRRIHAGDLRPAQARPSSGSGFMYFGILQNIQCNTINQKPSLRRAGLCGGERGAAGGAAGPPPADQPQPRHGGQHHLPALPGRAVAILSLCTPKHRTRLNCHLNHRFNTCIARLIPEAELPSLSWYSVDPAALAAQSDIAGFFDLPALLASPHKVSTEFCRSQGL